MASESLGSAVLELRTDDSGFSSGIGSAKNLAVGLSVAFAAATAAAVSLVKVSVDAAAEFESSFAGVRKTVNATEEEFADLSAGLRELSTEIPINVNELNAIAEAAGQLGIETASIESFTETMANLGVATNLTAIQAAESFAQIATVTKLPQSQFENLGSALVALGNNFATNEAKILDFSTRIAGAGATVGLTTPQIFGIGTAFASDMMPSAAKATPSRPPRSEIINASVRSCRMRRVRPAPMALRTAISLSRPAARVSNKFATLAHAISNTNATAVVMMMFPILTSSPAENSSLIALVRALLGPSAA